MFEKKNSLLCGSFAAAVAGFTVMGAGMVVPQSVQAAVVERAQTQLNVSVHQGVSLRFDEAVSSIFMADPAIASYQVIDNKKIIVYGRLPGDTTIFALNEDGKTVYQSKLHVTHDVSSIQKALRESYPDFKIELHAVNDGIAVRGVVPTAADAAAVVGTVDGLFTAPGHGSSQKKMTGAGAGQGGDNEESGAAKGEGTLGHRVGNVINQLTITTPNQVTVKVRIAEVNRKLTDRLGVRWGAGYGDDRVTIGTTGDGFLQQFGIPDWAAKAGHHFGAQTTIDALAREDLVSILAEPNLTVLSGETATFVAGGQIPFATYDSDGNRQIDFKDFGVLLAVSPTILSGNRISLKVSPEVSEPSYTNGIMWEEGLVQPGFIVRRADSSIELASGQSFAIAGLLKNDFSNSVSKIPGVGDMPVLGALARSKEFTRGETELIMVATAYISTPSGEPYVMPNEYAYVPDMWTRFFLNANPEVGAKRILPRAVDYIF